MPFKSGMECLSEINSDPMLRQLKIAVLSTSINPKNIRDAYGLGASFYAVKPTDINSLSRLISKILYHDWQRARERNEFLLNYNPPGFKEIIWFQ
jgi:DNA-binding NarL/FixJ family response regulator